MSAMSSISIFQRKYGLSYALVASEMNCGTPVATIARRLPISQGRASRATADSGCCENPRPSSRRSTIRIDPARNPSDTRWKAWTTAKIHDDSLIARLGPQAAIAAKYSYILVGPEPGEGVG